MIREIEIGNFKPFGEPQRLPLSRLNLIYGPNSSGKSSIIQALLLLRQSMEPLGFLGSSLITRGKYVDLGSLKSLLHKHELERQLTISLKYGAIEAEGSIPSSAPGPELLREVSTVFRASQGRGSRSDQESELYEASYSFSGAKSFSLNLVKSDKPEMWGEDGLETFAVATSALYQWKNDQSMHGFAEYLATSFLKDFNFRFFGGDKAPPIRHYIEMLKANGLIAVEGLPSRLTFRGTRSDTSSHVRFKIERFIQGVVAEYHSLINSIYYLGPLRSHPARHYLFMGGKANTVGARGEYAPQLIYQDKGRIEKEINGWFEGFDIPYTLRIRSMGDEITGEIIAMTLLDKRTNVEVAPSDVGFGIGQLLPIIVEGLVSHNRVICVEQPEIHLHPRLQASIADFLIKTSGISPPHTPPDEESNQNQWIIETHSEALMLRIQRRIRQKRISHRSVSVLYVEPVGGRGSRVTRLRLDENGNFVDEWPQGFFEEGYREQFDMDDE